MEILFPFFVGGLGHEVEGCRHLLRDLRPLLYFAHSLPHLVFVWVRNAYDLNRSGYLALTDLMTILQIVL